MGEIRVTGNKHFDIREFRKLFSEKQAYEYAMARLQFLGKGSSRAVFLYDSGKVLKIAYGMRSAGKAQNKAEVDVFSNPLAKPVVAKVFDYDRDFHWIISELVKPLDTGRGQYARSRLGFPSDYNISFLLRELELASKDSTKSIENIIHSGFREHYVEWDKYIWFHGFPRPEGHEGVALRPKITQIENAERDDEPVDPELFQTVIRACKRELKKRETKMAHAMAKIDMSTTVTFLTGLLEMKRTMGLELDDIMMRDEHLGMTADGRVVVLDYGFTEEIGVKHYLTEGGLGGHMSHLQDNLDLTFAEIKDIFRTLASRKNVIPVTEKIDGQNVFFTYDVSKGQVKFARNKSHLKTGGIGREEIVAKWAALPKVQTAYLEAYDVLQASISHLNKNVLSKLFGPNGNVWFSAEVTSSANPNVINYDGDHLVIHDSALSVNQNGEAVQMQNPEIFNSLISLIGNTKTQIAQKNWQIHGPKVRQLLGVKDVKAFAEGFQALNFVQGKYGLSNNSTLRDLVESALASSLPQIGEWPEEARKALAAIDGKTSERRQAILVALEAARISLGNTPLEQDAAVKELLAKADLIGKRAIEDVVMGINLLTLQVLNDLHSILLLEPKKETQRLAQELDNIKDQLDSGALNPEMSAKLAANLAKMAQTGELKNAIEGVVFQWKGNTYKLTYPFSALNQILGIFRYGK